MANTRSQSGESGYLGHGDLTSTIRKAWPLLSEQDVDRAVQSLDQLAAAIQERYGHPPEVASAAAHATVGHSTTPGRFANTGWVEVFAGGSDAPLGRGELLLFDMEPETDESTRVGEIAHLHLNGSTPENGMYLVRFEASGEIRETAMVWCDAGRGPAVAFLQPGLPITVRELSNGE